MTKTIHRLEDTAPDLYSILSKASGAELRSITSSVCELAVKHTGLVSPVVEKVIQHLQKGDQVSDQVRLELEQLVISLDEKYLSDDPDEGAVYSASADSFFAQARAASAVLHALSSDAFIAASESAYEALAATDDVDDISRIVAAAKSSI